MLKHFFIKAIPITYEVGSLITKRYAGHSKWANIKHIKGLKDGEKSKLFTKLGRQIRVAVTEGGSADPKKNLQLTQVIEQTRRANMPVATLQSILKSCENDKSQCKKYTLEIKGPGGCFILCEVYTSHLHSVKQAMATIIRKNNSKWSDGGGLHLFEEKGQIDTEHPSFTDKKEDQILEEATEHAIESGAEDVKVIDNNLIQFTCGKTNLNQVVNKLEKLGYKVTSAEVEYIPHKLQNLQDADLEICKNMYDRLENLPEVIRLVDNIA